jgi:hypothetical protein
LEADVYLFAGDYRSARQAIYALHKSLPVRDPFTPLGYVDLPARNSRLTGTVPVSGWAFDNVQVSTVDILVDGHFAGHASYGLPRPDVSKVWPHAPVAVGFKYSLDTIQYSNGEHFVVVKATDSSGNVGIFPKIAVLIDNPPVGQPK